MQKAFRIFTAFSLLFVTTASPIFASQGSVLGIHILSPSEAQSANELFLADTTSEAHYVTIPLTLDDLQKKDDWNTFFAYAQKQHLIPIVRLATHFENGSWQVPTKKNIVDLIAFLSVLQWPTEEKYIIAFNEVNHTQEWGGSLDPASYVDALRFTSDWAKSENLNYKVLPSAMDMDAPNGSTTKEGFAYLDQMLKIDPKIFSYVDYWNSHSYPNPAFSAPPSSNGKNSINGFSNELAYLQKNTGREFETFITETGWRESSSNRSQLAGYYQYAMKNVWSDPRVKGVTPFVLHGDPGPFSGFTFLNRDGAPTKQYEAYQGVLKVLSERK